MEKKKFNVLIWDFNHDKLEHYDVLPYLRDRYRDRKKTRRFPCPTTLEEFKSFVEDESRYQFWARCEYEMILHSWPPRKDGNEHKLDVHEQVMMNLDTVAEILYKEFCKEKEA